jgi:hypothetical protein
MEQWRLEMDSQDITTDSRLHDISIELGTRFREAYKTLGSQHETTLRLLEEYKEARRKIPGKSNDGTGYSTRHGAFEAFKSTQ